MSLKCIIVDEDQHSREILESYIEKISFLELKSSFGNAFEAATFIKGNEVDVVFMEIVFKEYNGMQLVKSNNIASKTIFITSFEQFAIEAFELGVHDYILKPISFKRLLHAISNIYKPDLKKEVGNGSIETAQQEYVFFKVDNKFQKVVFDDILFIEGMRDYLRICTLDARLMVLMSFKNIVDILPQNKFIRVHKSYMVSIDKIDKIEKHRVFIGNHVIPVGYSYRNGLYAFLKQFDLVKHS